MTLTPLPLEGAFEVQLAPRGDHRGYFMRTWCRDTFAAHGLVNDWVQSNESLSNEPGTVRGLHFQRPPHAETKLVQCVIGSVLDVIVDLRAGSATYGQHYAAELSGENHKCLYIPKGFAHGFCVLKAPAIIRYMVDHPYTGPAEDGLLWSDPALGIPWPVDAAAAITSAKDAQWKTLAELQPVEVGTPS
jgi:dTDP-4-dehydrorhamnose 3,5-epimerase